MAVNNVLKDKDGNILNPKIPRYEKLVDYTLESDSNEIVISNLNIKPGATFEMMIDGSSNPSDATTVNIGCYPNNNNNFNIARVVGFENNSGNIYSLYNQNTNNLYIARIIKGNNFIVDSGFSWNGSFLKNISSYSTPSLNDAYSFGNLSSMVNFSDSKLTSLRIVIGSGQFVAGTRVKIYGKV